MSPLPHLTRRSGYDPTAEIDRVAHEFADSLSIERLQAEIVRRLEQHCTTGADDTGFEAVHVVDTTNGLPDEAEVQLAILHPRHLHDPAEVHGSLADPVLTSAAAEQTLRLTSTRGAQPRRHRNAVIALAADAHHYPMLEAGVREFLAWSHVAAMAHALGLPEEAGREALIWKDAAENDIDHLLPETYFWLLIPGQQSEDEPLTLRVLTAEGAGGTLAERAALTLRAEGELVTSRDDHAIRSDLNGPLTSRWRTGHVSVGELWELYTSLPYLPRLRDRSVLEAGLVAAIADELDWQYQGFALADGYDQRKASYLGLRLPGDDRPPEVMRESTLVVRPDRAVEQRHSDTARAALDQLRTIDHLDHEDPVPPLPRLAQGETLTPEALMAAGRGLDDEGRPTGDRERSAS
ncbi:hypothetical protein [Kineosporia sp. NBRC 101731]|uniref:hypothetical protein n=1 Tax=Kineosporia sp. NBRC 101731 TaxID=3032199 RepID=UPI0024A5B876|nr:hypothetical protein [Kineosporia sp. NBRC 101731]GLY27179.1 hypothetical protein Kisp02_05440 [Kineosporia sp. NBRC 101731]